MTTRVGAKQARDNFSQLLGTVHYGKETVIVEKAGKPFVVVISPEEYDRYRQLVRQRAVQLIEHVHQRNEDVDPAELERDIVATVEQVRHERYAQQGQ
ncbi:MAG: type II toxin-antitoxin system Phd/YefM family antitoxin [Chloroflexota bacterium]